MTLARMSGAIDGPLTDGNLGDCDLLFVAICPAAAIAWVKENAEKIAKKTILVDLCGVKRVVVDALAPVGTRWPVRNGAVLRRPATVCLQGRR